MLLVLLTCEEEWYGIDAEKIVEIVPFAALKFAEKADLQCAVLIRHGRPISVIDFTYLTLDRPSNALFSTRIIIVRVSSDGALRKIGILAEGVTETLKIAQPENTSRTSLQPFSEQTVVVEGRSIHLVDIPLLSTLCTVEAFLENIDPTPPMVFRHD